MSSKNKFYFIKGNNVYLRPFKLKDISKKYLNWLNNPEINYGIEARFPVSELEAKNFFKETQGLKNKILFAICDNKSNKHIGNCLISNIDWINRRCRYGRLIGEKNRRKKGIGTEVTKLIQEVVFNKLNLNTMFTGSNETNIASIKSNLNAGMKKEGVSREAIYINGKYYNQINFAITKKDFLKKRK